MKKLILILMLIPVCVQAQPYLEQGLVAFWPFNGNANDYSGNGYNGTAVGTWPVNDHNGVPGMAYYFDGLASKVTVMHDKFVTSYLTLSFFIMITENIPYNNAMACSDFIVFTKEDSVGITISLPAQRSAAAYSQLNKWTHVVATYDNNDIRLYTDGTLQDSVYFPGIIHDMDWNMVMGGFGSNYWEGELDDIRIYDRVLSSTEIGQLYDYYGLTEPEKAMRPRIWPQPCQDRISFGWAGAVPQVRVYSSDGRCLLDQEAEYGTASGVYTLVLGSLPAGYYFLEISDGQRTQTAPCIITH